MERKKTGKARYKANEGSFKLEGEPRAAAIAFRPSLSLDQEIRQLSQDTGMSLSEILESAVSLYLKSLK